MLAAQVSESRHFPRRATRDALLLVVAATHLMLLNLWILGSSMEWLIVFLTAIAIAIIYEVSPQAGGALLILIVLGILLSAVQKGYA